MTIDVVYVFPMGLGYEHHAERFLASYLDNPPLVEHKTTVVCNSINGHEITPEIKGLFSVLQGVSFLKHDNSGYDIGGYQAASAQSQADMIVFFGASAYVRKPGWLLRMASAFQRHGEAQYGSMANRGDGAVQPHLRTTGFWTSPKLFNSYPERITQASQRHPFEHGPKCFTTYVSGRGLQNWLVTAIGDYLWAEWDNAPGGFHRDMQENLLTGDHLSESPYYKCS